MKIKKTLFKTEIEITTGELFDLEHAAKWKESLITIYYMFLLKVFKYKKQNNMERDNIGLIARDEEANDDAFIICEEGQTIIRPVKIIK